MNQARTLPRQFQIDFNQIQVPSYGSIKQQQEPRLLPTTSYQQQTEYSTQQISQPLAKCIY